MKLFYDLHIHSCLSPCGDEEMTPNNIVNMSYIKGLDVIALTDHNIGQNVKAVMACAEALGILVIPGMEIQTKEEIHALCYFPSLDQLAVFENALEAYRLKVPNRVDKFGHQWVMNEADEVIDEYPYALILSLSMGLTELDELVQSMDGVMVPAHINKGANSLIKYLGFVPSELKGRTLEVFNKVSIDPNLIDGSRIIYNSDAHFITDINEREHFMNVDAATIESVIKYLKGRNAL